MNRLASTRIFHGSWTSICFSAGLCACLTLAIVSYVGARAEGRDLFAGPEAVSEGGGPPLFPLQEEGCGPRGPVRLVEPRVTVPLVVQVEPGEPAQEQPGEPTPGEILEVQEIRPTPADASRRSSAKSQTRTITKFSTTEITKKGVSAKATSAKTSEATSRRSERRRRVSLQGAVVGVQIGTAVKSAIRPTSASPVNYEGPAETKRPSTGGIGMNLDGR